MTANNFVSPLRFWSSAVGAAGIEVGIRAFDRGDFNNALLTFNQLADAGNTQAQHYLGEMYANGYGVTIECDTAVFWLRAAADSGYAPSQRRLGEYYSQGACGLQLDQTQAQKWLAMAAESGDEAAVEQLKGLALTG